MGERAVEERWKEYQGIHILEVEGEREDGKASEGYVYIKTEHKVALHVFCLVLYLDPTLRESGDY